MNFPNFCALFINSAVPGEPIVPALSLYDTAFLIFFTLKKKEKVPINL